MIVKVKAEPSSVLKGAYTVIGSRVIHIEDCEQIHVDTGDSVVTDALYQPEIRNASGDSVLIYLDVSSTKCAIWMLTIFWRTSNENNKS